MPDAAVWLTRRQPAYVRSLIETERHDMRRERYPVARGEQAQAFYGAGLSELTTYLTTCQAPFPCLFQTCTYFPTSGEAAPEAGTMVH